MVTDSINLRSLNLDELNGVISLYPWFGGARKELCRRMAELGDGAWSDSRYADAALYLGSRRILADMARDGRKADCSDKDIERLLKNYISGDGTAAGTDRKVIVVGGDYFSSSQYENVRRSDDNIFSSFAAKAREEGYAEVENEEFTAVCTETLAQIYVEQGYYEQAKDIYSKLSLRYPEKSIYFAALIEKLNK